MREPSFDDYLDLPEAEREALRQYVAAHPDLSSDLAAVDLIDQVVRAIGTAQEGTKAEATNRVLRYLLYTRMVQPDLSSPLAPLWSALDAQAAADPDFNSRLAQLRQAILETEPKVDALAQFERLSGYRLGSDEHTQRDRAPRQNSRASRRRLRRWAGAVMFVLVGAYGALFTVSQGQRSGLQQLALLGNDALGDVTTGPTRGVVTPPPNEAISTDELFRHATRMLRNSRSTSLGLFPRYDPDSLAGSIIALEAVISREEDDSFYIGQAYFALGQAYLLLDDAEAAQASLEAALSSGAHSATLAQQQLDALSR